MIRCRSGVLTRAFMPATIRGYDLRRPEDPNVLTPDEAWCSRIIGSRMTRSERDELSRRGPDPRGAWGGVGADSGPGRGDPFGGLGGIRPPPGVALVFHL